MKKIYNRNLVAIDSILKRKKGWRSCLALLFGVFLSISSFAQETGTIQIGSGTGTVSGSTAVPVTNYVYSYSQQIITATQYATGGGASGNITKIRFKATNVGTLTVWNNWTVYIGNTTKTSFQTATDWVPLNNLTQVFSGVLSPDPTANNWFEITFSTPFNYTGGNLVIAVDENTLGWQTAPTFSSFTSTANSCIMYRSDSTNPDPANPPTAFSRNSILSQMQFEGVLASCLAPTNLTASNLTLTSATLSWDGSPSAPISGYDVYYSATNTAPVAETLPTLDNQMGVSAQATGLSASTTYYWWVRSDCGSGQSAWVSGGSFVTLCESVTSFPWTENFESVTVPNLPNCWSANDANADNDKWISYTTYGVAGSNATGLYTDFNNGSNNDYLILPAMTLTGNQRLKFFVRARSTGEPNDYRVVLSTTGNQPADFTNVIKPLTSVSSTTMTEIEPIDLSAYSGDVYIAVHVPSGGLDGYYLYVDNFTVEENPACIAPTVLAASNLTFESADLSWTSGGTSFDIEWGAQGFAQSEGTMINGVSNNYTLSGLDANTAYSFYVRNVCGGGNGNSTWSGPYAFYTGYCVPTGTSNSYRISGVSTTGGYTNISNLVNGTTLPYNNYTAMSVSQSPGESVTYTVNVPSSTGIKIWVDLNNNLVFDSNELVASHLTYSSTGVWTGTLAIPSELPLGDYRMRIRSQYYSYTFDACGDALYGYGEAEDYTLSVVAPPSCLAPSGLTAVVTSLSSADLSWMAPESAPANGYQWEVRTSGIAGSGATGLVTSGTTEAGTTNASASGLVLDSNHTLYVRSLCGEADFSTWASSASFLVGYCVPVTTNGCTDGDVIARVVLNTLDNNSGTGCPSETLGYSNYTSDPLLTTTLQAGNSYSCTVYAGEWSEGYAAWIDYNNDGVFDNVTERIGFSNGQVAGSGTAGVLGSSATFPVVISCNPIPGDYRLRVRAMFNINGSAVTPCTANSYGETEDYIITISPAVACPQPNLLATASINAQGATLNWSAGCEETLWDVHVGLQDAGAPAGEPSDVGVLQSFVKTGLLASTQYEFWVRANCGGGSTSEWSGPFLFETSCPSGIWLGSTDSSWSTASNWSDGVVPQPCTAVSVNETNPLVISSDVEVASISVGANANVTVNATLNVGNITVAEGGMLTVANDAVVLQTALATNTGMVTVKRNSTELFRQDYTLWSSPVSGQNLRAFSTQTLFNRFSSYDTALGTNGNYVQEIVTAADMNTKTFGTAKGYLIRMPNNWVEIGSSNPAQPYLGSFTGTLNNGTVSIALSGANNKLNLVGNPYASPISIAAFFAANTNIDETLYFWRKRGSEFSMASGYATYTAMGIASADTDIDGTMPMNIQTGQGFFVVANSAAPGNLVFNNGMRNDGAANFYKGANESTTEMHRFWLNLSDATNVVGQTLIGYRSGATETVDAGVDALYFNDSATALTSLIDNAEYIIQGRSVPFVNTDIVPLGFKSDVAGSYTIALANFDGLFAENQDIFLKDNVTGALHNLKVADYTFTTMVGVFNERFEVLYANTTLGTNNPVVAANTILIGVKDQKITINAGTVTMDKVELIDVTGRVIYMQDGVNATTATLENVVAANQMLIVRISTKENGIVTQKIIF